MSGRKTGWYFENLKSNVWTFVRKSKVVLTSDKSAQTGDREMKDIKGKFWDKMTESCRVSDDAQKYS